LLHCAELAAAVGAGWITVVPSRDELIRVATVSSNLWVAPVSILGLRPPRCLVGTTAGERQGVTVTRMKVAGMTVRAGAAWVFCASNNVSSSDSSSVALPFDAAAAKAFIVGP